MAALIVAVAGCMPANQAGPTISAAPQADAMSTADQTRSELAASRADFVSAYNNVDLDRFLGLFDDSATYAGLRQTTWVKGKDELRAMWKIAFDKDPSRRFVYTHEPLMYVSPDNRVSVEAGYAEMRMAPGVNVAEGRMSRAPMRVSITRIRTDQGWKIVNMDVSPQPTSVAPGFLPGH
jgi:hypothetical protein